MIRQISPNALQLVSDLNSKRAKMIPVSDAGELQQLRRVYSAARQYHLAVGPHRLNPTVADVFNPRRPPSLGDDAFRKRARDYREVRPR